MSAIATTRALSADELRRLEDEAALELVNGRLVEGKMGAESSEVAILIASILVNFIRPRKLGKIFGSDAGFKCFSGGNIRKPDVSFVRLDRLPGKKAPKGFCEVTPDLAVEVLSPHDETDDIDEKI